MAKAKRMHTHFLHTARAFGALVIASALALTAPSVVAAQGQTEPGEPGTLHLLQLSVERGSEVEEDFKERAVQVRSCEEARLLGVELSAKMVENQSVKLVQLPERLQALLSKMATGQATPPFGADDGPIRVLVICNRF